MSKIQTIHKTFLRIALAAGLATGLVLIVSTMTRMMATVIAASIASAIMAVIMAFTAIMGTPAAATTRTATGTASTGAAPSRAVRCHPRAHRSQQRGGVHVGGAALRDVKLAQKAIKLTRRAGDRTESTTNLELLIERELADQAQHDGQHEHAPTPTAGPPLERHVSRAAGD